MPNSRRRELSLGAKEEERKRRDDGSEVARDGRVTCHNRRASVVYYLMLISISQYNGPCSSPSNITISYQVLTTDSSIHPVVDMLLLLSPHVACVGGWRTRA